MTNAPRLHNTPAPSYVGDHGKVYTAEATFYLNCKGYRIDGITPFPKVPLTNPWDTYTPGDAKSVKRDVEFLLSLPG